MLIGVPREIKRDEYRVAMLPVGVEELTRAGHQVLIESGAGIGSGITDAEYAAEGRKSLRLPRRSTSRPS
jgi:alanine dehydrogenase